MSKTWEVRSEIIFPKAQIAQGKDGKLPEKLEYVSRFIEGNSIQVEDALIFLKKCESSQYSEGGRGVAS